MMFHGKLLMTACAFLSAHRAQSTSNEEKDLPSRERMMQQFPDIFDAVSEGENPLVESDAKTISDVFNDAVDINNPLTIDPSLITSLQDTLAEADAADTLCSRSIPGHPCFDRDDITAHPIESVVRSPMFPSSLSMGSPQPSVRKTAPPHQNITASTFTFGSPQPTVRKTAPPIMNITTSAPSPFPAPTVKPSTVPTTLANDSPSFVPTTLTGTPSTQPSVTALDNVKVNAPPSFSPSMRSGAPSVTFSSTTPSSIPTIMVTTPPTIEESGMPTIMVTTFPTIPPSSVLETTAPSLLTPKPSMVEETGNPTYMPSLRPSFAPSLPETGVTTSTPSLRPSSAESNLEDIDPDMATLPPSTTPSFTPTATELSDGPETESSEVLDLCPPLVFGFESSCNTEDLGNFTCGDFSCCRFNTVVCAETQPCLCSSGEIGCTTVDQGFCPNNPSCPLEEPLEGDSCDEQTVCTYEPLFCSIDNSTVNTRACVCSGGIFVCIPGDFEVCDILEPTAAPTAVPTIERFCPLVLPDTGEKCGGPDGLSCAYETSCCTCNDGVFACADRGEDVSCEIAECPVEALSFPFPANCSVVKDFECEYNDVSTSCSCEEGDLECLVTCPDEQPASGDVCLVPENFGCLYGTFCCPGHPDQCFFTEICECQDGINECRSFNHTESCADLPSCPLEIPSTGDVCTIAEAESCGYGELSCCEYRRKLPSGDFSFVRGACLGATECTCTGGQFECSETDLDTDDCPPDLYCDSFNPCDDGFQCTSESYEPGECASSLNVEA